MTMARHGLIFLNQVIKLFDTLSRYVYLASYLQRLGIYLASFHEFHSVNLSVRNPGLP